MFPLTPQLSPPDLPNRHAYTLSPGHPTPGLLNFLRPHIALHIGAGILTSFPSTTHLCLALGADSPCADERCAGILGFSANGLFTRFNATHVSIRTSDISSKLYNSPSQTYRTLSYHLEIRGNTSIPSTPFANDMKGVLLCSQTINTLQFELPIEAHHFLCMFRTYVRAVLTLISRSAASVHGLSPVTSSAQDDSISELLRFL
jgi:hypothetical protein